MTDHASRWSDGDAYVRYVGRWSVLVGREFLAWLKVPAWRRWLDVGCGTGTITSQILEHSHPESVVGIDPSAGFVDYAREHVLNNRARFEIGDARLIPFPDQYFDVTVSGLVLNFIPTNQQASAAAELHRVTMPGGTIGAYVWDYADGQEMMRYFWDTAVDLDPQAREQAEAIQFPLCHPAPLAALFEDAGLDHVETGTIEIQTAFADFDDFWTPFLSGEAPAPAYNRALSEDARSRLRDEIKSRLPIAADGSITLLARAWAVRGTVPEAMG